MKNSQNISLEALNAAELVEVQAGYAPPSGHHDPAMDTLGDTGFPVPTGPRDLLDDIICW